MSVREGNVVDMLETLRTRAARERDPLELASESLDRLDELTDQLESNMARAIAPTFELLYEETHRYVLGLERELKASRRHARELGRELEMEHRLRFPFEDTDVLAALREIGGAPVRARVVASAMFPESTLWHGDVIRVGFALGRLADRGLVRRLASRGSGSGAVWQALPNDAPARHLEDLTAGRQ